MKQSIFRKTIKILILAFCIISISAPLETNAQAPANISIGIEQGFSDTCKTNQWLPLWITLKNSGEDFSGMLEISQSDTASYNLPISLPANGQKEIHSQIYLDSNSSQNISFLLKDTENKTVQVTTQNVSCTTNPIIGVVSSTPSAFTVLNGQVLGQSIQNPGIAFFDLDRIPESALGLQALNYLFISNVDVTRLTNEQHEAIETWVSQGGQLILSGGTNWQINLTGFEALLPLQINTSITSNVFEGLRSLDIDFSMTDVVLSTGKTDKNANVIFEENGVPLVIQGATGSGMTTLLTFDPNQTAFRSWDQLEYFYQLILNTQTQLQQETQFQDPYAAQNASITFPNMNIPSLWLVCSVLLFYIVLVGPVNYIILGFMKKRELAWITIPGLIIVFSLAFILIGSGLQGKTPQSNQLAVVQFSQGDTTAQVRGLYGVFSPTRENYTFEISDGFAPFQLQSRNYYSNDLDNEWSFYETQAYIAETRIDRAGFATLGLQGFIPVPAIQIESELKIDAGQIHMIGSVVNATDVTLIDSVIAYPNGQLEIGELAPGEKESFDIVLNSSGAVFAPGNPPPLPGGNGGITTEQILGYSYYSDPDLNKRAKFLEALFGYYNIPTPNNTNFIFVAWDETQTPFDINIVDHDSKTDHLTAYIIPIVAELTVTESGSYEIPSFLFDWGFSNNSYVDNYESPYDLGLSNQEVVEIIYQLNSATSLEPASSLILHIQATYGEAQLPAELSIWNYSANQWDILNLNDSGDYSLPSSLYLSQHGKIQLKIKNISTDNYSYLHFSQVDFSLMMEP